MAEEIIIQGKTLEEAMAEAQSKYNGDNVQFDILEMPRRGIFGIGASPAKIKVIINDVEDDEDTDLSGIVASIKGLGVTTNKGGGDEQPDRHIGSVVEEIVLPHCAVAGGLYRKRAAYPLGV